MSVGSLVNDADVVPFVTEDALDAYGYVMAAGSAAGKVKKAPAGASKNSIIGVAFTDTKDMDGNAKSNVPVGVVVKRGVIVLLKLAPDNQAVSYGAPLCVDSATAGTVDYRDGTNETGDVIAIALEDKPANDGGHVKALLL